MDIRIMIRKLLLLFAAAIFFVGCFGTTTPVDDDDDSPDPKPITNGTKGAIVAYLPEYRNAPTDAQLERLTHLVLFSAEPKDHNVALPTGGWAKNVEDVVVRAHAKGVKVCFALGGWGRTGSFPESVKEENRQIFINNIMNLVNAHGFDGIDIDWEYPRSEEEIANFEGFMIALKAALGEKRLSFAIGANFKTDLYTKATFDAMDALHLMTYDMGTPHSEETRALNILDDWIESGQIAKEKVFLGVPFYGRAPEEMYSKIIKDDPATLSQLDEAPNGDDGTWYYDGIPTIKRKTEHAYNAGAGGIMIWELGQDVTATSEYSLLNAIYEQTKELGGYK